MSTIKILFVDDQEIRNDLFEIFDGMQIGEYTIEADTAENFEIGIDKIKNNYYDIAILDLCEGEPSDDVDKKGLNVLSEIQKEAFIPVIFFSAIAYSIEELRSEIVGVVSKADGNKKLEIEIKKIVSSNIGLLKSKILNHINEELKNYFWEIIDKEKDIFKPNENDYSLGYLMLRRLSHSLSKANIKKIIGDTNINEEKIHPMEFYIYPTNIEEFEIGEIISKDDNVFVMLTPSCDYIERTKKDLSKFRKVGKVLLAKAIDLKEFSEYTNYKTTQNKDNTSKLISLITNNSDRYFFLPKTPFIENKVVDFQNKIMVEYEDLSSFKRIAKLDDPFAQSMVSSFIRYYNRIGFPDIDSDYVLANL